MSKKERVPPTFKEEVAEEEEVEAQFTGFQPPALELVMHEGGIMIEKVPIPEGVVTILRFVTPSMVFTVRLNEPGVAKLVSDLTGGIVLPNQQGIIVPK